MDAEKMEFGIIRSQVRPKEFTWNSFVYFKLSVCILVFVGVLVPSFGFQCLTNAQIVMFAFCVFDYYSFRGFRRMQSMLIL